MMISVYCLDSENKVVEIEYDDEPDSMDAALAIARRVRRDGAHMSEVNTDNGEKYTRMTYFPPSRLLEIRFIGDGEF